MRTLLSVPYKQLAYLKIIDSITGLKLMNQDKCMLGSFDWLNSFILKTQLIATSRKDTVSETIY